MGAPAGGGVPCRKPPGTLFWGTLTWQRGFTLVQNPMSPGGVTRGSMTPSSLGPSTQQTPSVGAWQADPWYNASQLSWLVDGSGTLLVSRVSRNPAWPTLPARCTHPVRSASRYVTLAAGDPPRGVAPGVARATARSLRTEPHAIRRRHCCSETQPLVPRALLGILRRREPANCRALHGR